MAQALDPRFWLPAAGSGLYMETVEAAVANTAQAPSAGQAFAHPAVTALTLEVSMIRVRLGTGGSGSNYVLGIYDGSGERLAATGLVALASGTNAVPVGPLLLQPGVYWLAISFGNATPTVYRAVLGSGAQRPRSGYVSGAHPLPAWLDLSTLVGINQVVWLQAAEL
jgi:hypothetical protein